MLSMSEALSRIKGDTAQFLDAKLLRAVRAEAGLAGRDRLLTPAVTTHLFVRQVLEGNVAVPELRRLAKVAFADSSYCAARRRLPLRYFQRLNAAVLDRCRRYAAADRRALWHGHRVFLLDGSSFSMPDTPDLQAEFGQPGGQAAGCGFPTAHLLVQFHHYTGYLTDALPAPLRTHDLADVEWTRAGLRAGDVVAGDRAFCSYAHLALLQKRGVFGLFRAHQRLIISFKARRPYVAPGRKPVKGVPRSRFVRRLGRCDQLVEYFKPDPRPSWLSAAEYDALPPAVVVRELRLQVNTPGGRVRELTLVTTLLDAERYPKGVIGRLYEKRWGADTAHAHCTSSNCGVCPGRSSYHSLRRAA